MLLQMALFHSFNGWVICYYIHVPCLCGFPSGSVDKEPACNAGDAGDVGSIPWSGRSPGGGHGDPIQCSCLENSMDRGAWWATVHGHKESDMTENARPHHIFIHSSVVDGQLGCFHVLGIINSAAMNIGVHISFKPCFYLDMCPGVGLLDHILVLFLFS